MPRPLILKVTSHHSQPNSKASGSINLSILRRNSVTNLVNNENSAVVDYLEGFEGSSSLVQSLVNKYESVASTPAPSSSANLFKFKSKSMGDLHYQTKPSPTVITKTQDYLFYHEDNVTDEDSYEERRKNFQQALNRFQNSSGQTELKPCDIPANLSVREKAQKLLQATKHDYFWFNQVVGLLQQIVNDTTEVEWDKHRSRSNSVDSSNARDGDDSMHQSVNNHKQVELDQQGNRSGSAGSLSDNDTYHDDKDITAAENNIHVSEMKQIYEEKVTQIPKFLVETSENTNEIQIEKKEREQKKEPKLKVPLKYFGKVDTDSDESTLTDTDERGIEDVCTGSKSNDKTPEPSESFECIDLSPTSHDRTPEPELLGSNDHDTNSYILDDEIEDESALHEIENVEALKTIEVMLRNVEECEKEIDTLTPENSERINYLNDILLKALLKLDDLQTHDDDGVIVTMRKRAFAITQNCIKKLKVKVFS